MLFDFDHDVMNVEKFAANRVVFERHRVKDFDEAMIVLNHLRQTRLNDGLTLLEIAEGSVKGKDVEDGEGTWRKRGWRKRGWRTLKNETWHEVDDQTYNF